jgi:hypothetical protein
MNTLKKVKYWRDVPENYTGIVEYPNGSREYLSNRLFHRDDGPAVEQKSGTKYWYLNGKLHRIDGPAIVYADGDKYWYLNGLRHRSDGPAIECHHDDGSWDYEWWLNGINYFQEEWFERLSDEDKERAIWNLR